MIRRAFLSVSAAAAIFPRALIAEPKKPPTIYMITWRGYTDVEKGFQTYLKDKNLAINFIIRDAEQDPLRLKKFADEIHRVKPDLIYTWGTSATLGIVGTWDRPANDMNAYPLVFSLVASAVGAKILPPTSNHGINVTGVSHMAPIETQIAAMRSYRPFKRVGILYNRLEQNSVAGVEELRQLARMQGFSLIERVFNIDASGRPASEGIAELIAEIHSAGADWLYIGPDSFLFTRLQDVADAANSLKIPTFATTEAVMNSSAGILAGLVSKYYSVGQFAGLKAEQIIFRGTAASTIPVETLSRFSFLVRMETAIKIKCVPPISLFNVAEFVDSI